jgi:cell wall-associated NlpC family hydrolase
VIHALPRPRALLAATLLPLLMLVLVGGMLATAPGAEAARGDKIRKAARVATHQVGDRYQYGAAGPRRFDCSGLVYFSSRRAGLSGVPRTSRDQARHTRKIAKRDLRRGDLMFFHDGGDVYHVGIFLRRKGGKPVMVHSPSTGKRVHRATPWTSQWYAGTLRRR